MKIYIEQILLTNFIIDWCILLIVSKFIFSKPNYKHITLSATFGSVATLIMPYCTNLILANILKILTSIIMLQLLQIKTKKQLALSSLLMLVLTYIIGGAVLSTFGTSYNGGYIINNINLLPIFAVTVLFTFIICKLISWLKFKVVSNSNIYYITLVNNSNQITIKSFIDSGNGLYDQDAPVSLINFETFNKLTNISLTEYINKQFDTLNNAHFIEANTIAGKQKILVFTINELHLKRGNIKVYKNITLGVALHFDNSKEYKAILNSCFCYT